MRVVTISKSVRPDYSPKRDERILDRSWERVWRARRRLVTASHQQTLSLQIAGSIQKIIFYFIHEPAWKESLGPFSRQSANGTTRKTPRTRTPQGLKGSFVLFVATPSLVVDGLFCKKKKKRRARRVGLSIVAQVLS